MASSTVRPTKKETHKSGENCNDLSEKAYIFTFILTPVTRCIDMQTQWPFQMVMSKMICAEWEFKGLTGSATIQNKGTCWYFCLFCHVSSADSLLTWISDLNLVIVLNTIILRKSFLTCMSLNCSLSPLRIIMCLVSTLIMNYTVILQWLTDKTGFLLGRTV